jgi:ubiquinol-cytochrome c reductase subunit 8
LDVADATGYFVYTWGKTKYEYYNSKEGHHAMAHSEGH